MAGKPPEKLWLKHVDASRIPSFFRGGMAFVNGFSLQAPDALLASAAQNPLQVRLLPKMRPVAPLANLEQIQRSGSSATANP
jgi:hypothetical protein